jgi:hypothetical protein
MSRVNRVERLFRRAGSGDASDDHRNHGWEWGGVACRVPAARRRRGPNHCDRASVRRDGWSAPPAVRVRPGATPGRLALAVADGATTISDIAVLADQAGSFGAVASDSTYRRLLGQLDTIQLGVVAHAERRRGLTVWAQRAEAT